MIEILRELNVLYVDDDLKACESLEYILKYYFNNIFIAHNGKEALDIYLEKKCHLLIVDYDMPIMDGYEFLSEIRKTDNETPALIISSYDDTVKLRNAIKLNLLDYLIKPYELDELKNVLNRFVESFEKKDFRKIKINDICHYNSDKKILFINDKQQKLTSYEIKIFEHLLKNRKKIVSYEELLNILNSQSQKSLITIIYKIKKKLPHDIIENIKDIGYKLI